MKTFSESVYPQSGITSMRSSSGAGIASTLLAVQMKRTRERSKGTPR